MILHDWSDEYCVKILRYLRATADKSTKLLIVENIVSYACTDTLTKDIHGAERPPAPAPLLPNFGHSNTIAYYTDLTVRLTSSMPSSTLIFFLKMMSLLNGQERTVLQLKALMKQGGWNLVEVYHSNPFAVGQSKAIGIPI
jgi:hypothetical protein